MKKVILLLPIAMAVIALFVYAPGRPFAAALPQTTNCTGAPVFNSVTIAAISRSAGMVTANLGRAFAPPNGNGDYIRITGVPDRSFDGQFQLTSGSGTSVLTWRQSATIISIHRVSSTNTVTAILSGYFRGSTVVVTGVNDASFDGTFTLTLGTGSSTVGSTTLTWTQVGTDADSSSGTIRAPDASPKGSGTVDDLAVILNGNSAMIRWSTPGYNSSSFVGYGNDGYSQGYAGASWSIGNRTTGVSLHQVTLRNLATNSDAAIPYYAEVMSQCFTKGVPDTSKAVRGGGLTFIPKPLITAGALNYGLSSGPIQDSLHPGFHAVPGHGVIIPLYASEITIPNPTYNLGLGYVRFTLSGSLITDYGISSGVYSEYTARYLWSGQPIDCNGNGGNQYSIGCGIDLDIPTNVATSGTACTNHAGAVDLGSGKGCAYPIVISTRSDDGNCAYNGGTWDCQQPSSTVWIIVQSLPRFSPVSIGPVCNPWPGCFPCLTEATKQSHGCTPTGESGGFYSYLGNLQNFGHFYGLITEAWSNMIGQQTWFYDGDIAEKEYGDYIGSTSPWYGYARNIAATYRDLILPLIQEATTTLSYTQVGSPTLPGNRTCANFHGNGNSWCGTLIIKCGSCDASSIATGLAAGESYVDNFTFTSGRYGGTYHVHVVAANDPPSTITLASQIPNAVPGDGVTHTITRELNGIPADAGSDATHIICRGCDFTNVARNAGGKWPVCYNSVTDSPYYSHAPIPGAVVQSVSEHTITLATPIAGLGPGSIFQCRRLSSPPAPQTIYDWPEGLYNNYLRNEDYVSLDGIMLESTNHPSNMGDLSPDVQREDSTFIHNCQRVMDLQTSWSKAAIQPSTSCTRAEFRSTLLDMMFGMMDVQVNNGMGNGTMSEDFMLGLEYWCLLKWQADPNTGDPNDPRFNYWVKTTADYQYLKAYSPTPQYYHQFPYMLEDCCSGWPEGTSYVVNGVAVSHYWAEQALIWPVYAWAYQLTGNGLIPGTSVHYGDAYIDMVRYGAPYSINDWIYHAKTLGQQGLWGLDGVKWIQGNRTGGR